MLLNLALLVAILVIAFVAFVLTRPNQFRVQRKAKINAPPERVFALLTDFHRWTSWSPWEALDPNLRRTHSGAASGAGAVYAWEGNKRVGEGRMEILEVRPSSKVTIKLDFLKPFEAHNTAEFTLVPSGGGTDVTWAMYGHNSLMLKAMSLFMPMDKMVGKDFEKGLDNLKRATEA
jgi:uncharacterized protein YndB with AHSA1/START domain